jgi:hypothetical protein
MMVDHDAKYGHGRKYGNNGCEGGEKWNER